MIDNKRPTVIWDWNGTLINDTQICIESMNMLLDKRMMPLLSLDKYLDVFGFPVQDYYKEIGFDFDVEPFEKPALEFIDYYKQFLPKANLFEDVENILIQIKNLGFNQMIVSAMEENALKQSVEVLGISNHFDVIVGIDNHLAKSKAQRAGQKIKELAINRNNMWFIGDTLHDKEVADELGCRCILVAHGHQSAERLRVNDNVVVKSLSRAFDIVIEAY